MIKTAKLWDKNPTKTQKNEKKTINPRIRQASKVKVGISSNKTQKMNIKMSVTGELQRD